MEFGTRQMPNEWLEIGTRETTTAICGPCSSDAHGSVKACTCTFPCWAGPLGANVSMSPQEKVVSVRLCAWLRTI